MRSSEPQFETGTLNPYVLSPSEIRGGDTLGYKVVVTVDYSGNFWSAFKGPTGWSDERVANEGDRISKVIAEALFPLFSFTNIKYYSG